MANTYTQITIHAVFAVQHRQNFILPPWRDDLHRYISGIITNQNAKAFAVGGYKDHVHILFGMPVDVSLADFMSVLKANSSKWINEKKFLSHKFQWQPGYGAFSFAKSQRDVAINYILNQEAHHQIRTFQQEYNKMLSDVDEAQNHRYLFDFFD